MDYDKVWVLNDKFTMVVPSGYKLEEEEFTYEGNSTLKIYCKELKVEEYRVLSVQQANCETLEVDVDTFTSKDDERQRLVKFSKMNGEKEYINLGYVLASDVVYVIDVEYDSHNQDDADEAIKIINSISLSKE